MRLSELRDVQAVSAGCPAASSSTDRCPEGDRPARLEVKLLEDLALLEHDDPIRFLDRRQAVGNQYTG